MNHQKEICPIHDEVGWYRVLGVLKEQPNLKYKALILGNSLDNACGTNTDIYAIKRGFQELIISITLFLPEPEYYLFNLSNVIAYCNSLPKKDHLLELIGRVSCQNTYMHNPDNWSVYGSYKVKNKHRYIHLRNEEYLLDIQFQVKDLINSLIKVKDLN